MASRYIPPALRNRGASLTSDQPPNSTTPAEDKASAPNSATTDENQPPRPTGRRLSDLAQLSLTSDPKAKDKPPLYTAREIHAHFRPPSVEFPAAKPESTLNNSVERPDGLAYVMLFPGANPRWGEGTVFAKSNLELLPGFAEKVEGRKGGGEGADGSSAAAADGGVEVDVGGEPKGEIAAPDGGGPAPGGEHDGRPTKTPAVRDNHDKAAIAVDISPSSQSTPIRVFAQRYGRATSRTISFLGYYRLTNLTYLPPHSTDLVTMQEQKWSQVQRRGGERTAESWKESLSKWWAVMQFEEDAEALERLGHPGVEAHPERDTEENVWEDRRGIWGRSGGGERRGGQRGWAARGRGWNGDGGRRGRGRGRGGFGSRGATEGLVVDRVQRANDGGSGPEAVSRGLPDQGPGPAVEEGAPGDASGLDIRAWPT